MDRVDGDPDVRAIVSTRAHPDRFVSYADVQWLHEGGAAGPTVGRRGASVVISVAGTADNAAVGVTAERSDAARNRARLLEAAALPAVERGPEQVTMREVAEAAGVGKGTLFRRFGDRDGLFGRQPRP